MKVGQAVTFTVDAYPGRVFQGNVQQVRIAPQVVQNVVTYDVVVSAPNADLGTAARPDRQYPRRHRPSRRRGAGAERWRCAIGLPGAVGATPGGNQRARSGCRAPTAARRGVAVKLGISDGNVTEVVDGALQPGSPVIVGDAPVGAAGRAIRFARHDHGPAVLSHDRVAYRGGASDQGIHARAADPDGAERRIGAHRPR